MNNLTLIVIDVLQQSMLVIHCRCGYDLHYFCSLDVFVVVIVVLAAVYCCIVLLILLKRLLMRSDIIYPSTNCCINAMHLSQSSLFFSSSP